MTGRAASVSVSDASSGRPISGAAVQISAGGVTVLESETDSEGQAEFAGIQDGAYRLRVTKPGYADLLDSDGLGRRVIVSSANRTAISVRMNRTVAISGQVMNAQGRPLQGAKVVAIVRRSARGRLRLVPLGGGAPTDDAGRYRLFGLPPGHYSVAVVPTEEVMGAGVCAPVYYPGTSDPSKALFFGLQAGDVMTSADLSVGDIGAVSLSGSVSSVPKEWNGGRAAVSLATGGDAQIGITTSLTAADGAFSFRGVPPGEYQLTAWGPISDWGPTGPKAGANARAASRALTVSVGGDQQVDLELRPLVTVDGRFVWDRQATGDLRCGGTGRVEFLSQDGWLDVWSPAVSVSGDRFTVHGLPPGRYTVTLPELGHSCSLTSLLVGSEVAPGGIAMVDGSAPLTLRIGAGTGEVAGQVSGGDDRLTTGMVLLVSADREEPPRAAHLDEGGRYRFERVPAGEYYLTAVKELNSMDYMDPVVVANTGAQFLRLSPGQKATADLRYSQQ